jgi:hypothetical protein
MGRTLQTFAFRHSLCSLFHIHVHVHYLEPDDFLSYAKDHFLIRITCQDTVPVAESGNVSLFFATPTGTVLLHHGLSYYIMYCTCRY